MASDEEVRAATVRWLERAVIGLNLCPFAKAPWVRGRVHLAITGANEVRDVVQALREEANGLMGLDEAERETTLLVVPGGFDDFICFTGLVAEAERMLRKQRFEGVLQLASFHPRYQFAGAGDDDIENYTNRSPHPILHLLRESSIDRAVQAFAEAQAIYGNNMDTLRRLGHAGWSALGVEPGS